MIAIVVPARIRCVRKYITIILVISYDHSVDEDEVFWCFRTCTFSNDCTGNVTRSQVDWAWNRPKPSRFMKFRRSARTGISQLCPKVGDRNCTSPRSQSLIARSCGSFFFLVSGVLRRVGPGDHFFIQQQGRHQLRGAPLPRIRRHKGPAGSTSARGLSLTKARGKWPLPPPRNPSMRCCPA